MFDLVLLTSLYEITKFTCMFHHIKELNKNRKEKEKKKLEIRSEHFPKPFLLFRIVSGEITF